MGVVLFELQNERTLQLNRDMFSTLRGLLEDLGCDVAVFEDDVPVVSAPMAKALVDVIRSGTVRVCVVLDSSDQSQPGNAVVIGPEWFLRTVEFLAVSNGFVVYY
jgi:hypothetical protein